MTVEQKTSGLDLNQGFLQLYVLATWSHKDNPTIVKTLLGTRGSLALPRHRPQTDLDAPSYISISRVRTTVLTTTRLFAGALTAKLPDPNL